MNQGMLQELHSPELGYRGLDTATTRDPLMVVLDLANT